MKTNFLTLYLTALLLLAGCVMPRHGEHLATNSRKAKPDNELNVAVLAKTTLSWNGAELPSFPEGQPEITILRISIPAGMSLPMHSHPVINAGVLTKGELTVFTEDGSRLHLKAGESIVEVVNTWHYGVNEGESPAEIIVFYAGTPDTSITVYRDKK